MWAGPLGFILGALLLWIWGQAALARALLSLRAEKESAATLAEERRRQLEAREGELRALGSRGLELERALAAEASRREELRRSLEEERALVQAVGKSMQDAFKALADEALRSNNQSFLDLARQSLEVVLTQGRGDLQRREEAIGGLLRPMADNLRQYQDQLRLLEKERQTAYGGLDQRLLTLTEAQERLQLETGRLVTALRAPQVRGRWGELTLRRVVELAGLSPYADFSEQVVGGEDNRRRPDLIVNLPSGRRLVVDAKVALDAYLDAVAATTEEERASALARHAAQVRKHLLDLSSKSYWQDFPGTAEFTVMFIPGEAFLAAAAEQDPKLLEDGLARRVIPATPSTLVALFRAVDLGWREERLAASAREVSELGKELYERLKTLRDHFERLGKGLRQATEAYNQAVGSLESRILVTARRFREIGVGVNVEIGELSPVETVPRELQAPEYREAEG